MRGIYFVAAHKLILNVSKIRLRLICACASYLYRLFPKGFFSQYTTHLLRRIAKSVHPCTLLAVSFGSAETALPISPAASVPLFKHTQHIISTTDGGGSTQQRWGCPKTESLSAFSVRKLFIISAKADCETVFGQLL